MTILNDPNKWRNEVRKIMTFRYLTDIELNRLLEVGDIAEYDLEEPIVQEGQVDQHFFGILEGTVSVSVQEQEGKEVFVCSLGPGEVFGEAGFFLKIKRTASVTALGKTTVLRLARKDLTALIREFPAAGNKFLLITIYGLLRKLRMANQELAYERKSDMNQEDVDDLINGLLSSNDLEV